MFNLWLFINNNIDGILIPGGFGYRGIEGKIISSQYARENKIPFGNSFVLSEENVHEVNSMLEYGYSTRPFLMTFYNINALGCDDFTPLLASSEKVRDMLRDVTSRNDYPFDIRLPVIFDPESKDFASQKCTQQWEMACFNDSVFRFRLVNHLDPGLPCYV